MKLNKKFLTHDDGKEKILVPTGNAEFSGIVRGNKTAGFIIDCLIDEASEDEIISKILLKYDVDKDIASRDVKNVIARLRSIGAIDE